MIYLAYHYTLPSPQPLSLSLSAQFQPARDNVLYFINVKKQTAGCKNSPVNAERKILRKYAYITLDINNI